MKKLNELSRGEKIDLVIGAVLFDIAVIVLTVFLTDWPWWIVLIVGYLANQAMRPFRRWAA